ncbi:unnamed protein product, partial [Chrysoparadoxa australica]
GLTVALSLFSCLLSADTACPHHTIRDKLAAIEEAMVSMHHQALSYCDSSLSLDPDTLFPVVMLVMIQACLPCPCQCLHYLRTFSVGSGSATGERSYFLTCLEACCSFVLRMETGPFKEGVVIETKDLCGEILLHEDHFNANIKTVGGSHSQADQGGQVISDSSIVVNAEDLQEVR